MVCRRRHGSAACLVLLAAWCATVACADPPRRVVSINLCTDALLIRLAPRERIAAVSYLARDPRVSPVAEVARGIPVVHGDAEEVLAFAPDLVLAGRYTTRASVILLRRLGIEVMELGLPASMEDVRGQIRRFAERLGESERGEQVLAELDARLAAVASERGAHRPLAVVYRPNGYTAGPRSLEGAVLDAAGYDNLAGRVGIEAWGQLPLEWLVRARPELLVFDEADGAPALARRVLEHPALRRLERSMPTVSVPASLWGCAGPWVAGAVERLASMRDKVPPAVNRR